MWPAVFNIPLIFGVWFLYEDFRKGSIDDKRSD